MDKTTTITIQADKETDLYKYFSEKDLEETAKELAYIEKHIEEYKKNNKWEDLKNKVVTEKC